MHCENEKKIVHSLTKRVVKQQSFNKKVIRHFTKLCYLSLELSVPF